MESGRRLLRKTITASKVLTALRLVWRAAPRWTVAQTTLLIVQSILPLAALYITKLVIDALSNNINPQPGIPEASWSSILQLLSILCVILVINNSLGTLSSFVTTMQGQKFANYMYDVLHLKSIEIDLEYYENPEYHDTLQRAQKEATYRPNQLLNNLLALAYDLVSLAATGAILFTIHWAISLLVLASALPALWQKIAYAGERYRWERQRTSLERQASYLSWLMIQDVYAKEVRIFGLGQMLRNRFNRLRKLLYGELFRMSRRFTFSRIAAQVVTTLLNFAAYGYIVYSTFTGRLTVGDLVFYYEILKRGQSAFGDLAGTISSLYEDKLFLDNLYDFLNIVPSLTAQKQKQEIPSPIQRGFRFENVDFSYTGSARQALHNIDIEVKPGEVIALVGENGSGKTTLIKLLCRLYDPTSGRITVDDTDIREFSPLEYRQQISVIFQDYVKYFMSARENIWLGNVELQPDDNRVVKSAVRSGADAVIQGLPHQYDTMLGKLFDGGEDLSIGQWQKIALARAFSRDAQLIVLDEPTSAMDPQAEYEVFQGFKKLIEDRSAILISHRLSTVRMADCIYLIDRGVVREFGTHQELMEKQGRYAHLFEIQAQNYR